ncbi:MAG: hypothetical protein V2J24_03710 [Pseudomonadales bacterium]|nr:hypothetical protein [Pseudomonadales bacterium]
MRPAIRALLPATLGLALGVLALLTARLLLPPGMDGWEWPSGDRHEAALDGGVLRWADGRVYEGDFVAGLPEGHGELRWPDGTRYVGAFEHGLPEGQGQLRTPDGLEYVGRFLAGHASGNGELRGPFGRYRGAVADGVANGRGELVTRAGDRFVGEFAAGVPHGEGRLDRPGGPTLRGRFSVGRPRGDMEVLYADGGRYTGPWRGVRVGEGTMRWPDGRRYSGTWVNDEPTGAGSLSWPDGRRFIGPVDAGIAAGEGWCMGPDRTERCRFDQGVRVDAAGPAEAVMPHS